MAPDVFGNVPQVGEQLPEVTLDVDHTMVVMSAAATNVFFRGHTDTAYAQSQGRRDVYLATGPIAGLLDRFVTSWAGPRAFLAKRTLTMRESICAGDTVRIRGEVTSVSTESLPGRPLRGPAVEVSVTIVDASDALCVSSTITLLLGHTDKPIATLAADEQAAR
ncbi:hypothetical protein ACLM5J_20290 [Nocardioides sp. Bht2]|uniref:hypothetical protein n=1 Tax=Nocardioides sp. Bht2 TaxID=3392297 RepID=UPI0039B3D5E6